MMFKNTLISDVFYFSVQVHNDNNFPPHLKLYDEAVSKQSEAIKAFYHEHYIVDKTNVNNETWTENDENTLKIFFWK